MADAHAAFEYLLGLHAMRHEIPIGNVIRGNIVMCSSYMNGTDYVYIYQRTNTAMGEEYLIKPIPLRAILKELQDAGFHGYYWIDLPSHIVTIEIWETGGKNF